MCVCVCVGALGEVALCCVGALSEVVWCCLGEVPWCYVSEVGIWRLAAFSGQWKFVIVTVCDD